MPLARWRKMERIKKENAQKRPSFVRTVRCTKKQWSKFNTENERRPQRVGRYSAERDGNVRQNKDGLIHAGWWREIRAKVFN